MKKEVLQEGVNQEVIDNVQGLPPGSVPPSPAAQFTVVEMMQFMMNMMQVFAGGSITGFTKDGVAESFPVPVPEAATTKDALMGVEPFATPTDGQMVADFPRATTLNLQDLMIVLQAGVDKVVPFQVLSNAILEDSYFKIRAISDINKGTQSGTASLSPSTLNTPEPNEYWVARIYNTGTYILQELRALNKGYTATRRSTDSGKAWSAWYKTTEIVMS